ncbi:hypothetical protein DX908_02670 [Parvularcula marina]|uniref:Uncharacterized protein n=1 Tax=Parvularcula marina TaxID=2292771 RepID=A0A371RFQ6_9PROT|nr:hypothetical protein DX908_02670 [Parvularcula marina]
MQFSVLIPCFQVYCAVFLFTNYDCRSAFAMDNTIFHPNFLLKILFIFEVHIELIGVLNTAHRAVADFIAELLT